MRQDRIFYRVFKSGQGCIPWNCYICFQSFLLQCFCVKISTGGSLDLSSAGMINLIYASHELIAIKEHIYIRDQEAVFNGKGEKEKV